jgi:type IV secretion system protein TrbL
MTQLSLFSPAESLGLMIASLIIVICFALIAAFMVITLVEAYVVMSAGVFFMGFGGSRWTQEYAMKMISYTVSVGAKLFILQLLIGLGESMIEGWAQPGAFDAKDQNIFIMVGAAIVMLALTKSIPELVQSLISGASVTHGSALTGAAGAAIQTAATIAGGAIGAGMAGKAASKLAGMQVASAASKGEAPGSRMGLIANNLASAGAQDVGRRLSGQAHHGTAGARMAGGMDYKAAEIKAEMDKPQPPASPQVSEAPSDNNRIYT